ncbi:MAG: transcriptional repressor NrdR [Clostridia bacterium]|nr:transcriptional repressor NrdR [Clostridia bacterium]
MNCPVCNFQDTKVIDSRPTQDGSSIRRRRECPQCLKRFTTFEILETVQIFVIKKDGTKEMFDKNKLLAGVLKACQKRPVNAEDIVSDIETELQNTLTQEIESGKLGEMVMRRLKDADKVAYVRFASVYREFKDIDTFFAELNELRGEQEK